MLAAGTIGQVHRAARGGDRWWSSSNTRQEPTHHPGRCSPRKAEAQASPHWSTSRLLSSISRHRSPRARLREEAANIERMEVFRSVLAAGRPWVHTRSRRRLLVMDEVVGVPLREALSGDERREAARQPPTFTARC
jgi:hypothetical protein